MVNMKRILFLTAILVNGLLSSESAMAQKPAMNSFIPDRQATYCNPINLDYGYCPIPNFVQNGKHRATADPIVAVYDNKYFLFSTNQWGYWWSNDMKDWKFISRKFLRPWNDVYDELCAPASLVLGDSLLVIGSTYTKQFTLWYSTNPTKDDWHVAVDSFQEVPGIQDYSKMMTIVYIFIMARVIFIQSMGKN